MCYAFSGVRFKKFVQENEQHTITRIIIERCTVNYVLRLLALRQYIACIKQNSTWYIFS